MEEPFPKWAVGPIQKPITEPVLSPSESGFDSWAVYNPAVTVKDGVFYMFYRAESRDEANTPYLGTSRIGMAVSEDGLSFRRCGTQPIIDADSPLELPGGCEDPRICRVGDVWHLIYGAYQYPGEVYLCHAVSIDLYHWEKKGPLLRDGEGNPYPCKSAAIVSDPQGNAVQVNGSYLLYTNTCVARSTDFTSWKAVPFQASEFSGSLHEVCVALTDYRNPGQDDILLFFAGNFSKIQEKDYFYAIGEALFDRNSPQSRKAFLREPVIKPELPFEKVSDRLAVVPESVKGTLFLDSVFRWKGLWYAYYGCSDQFVGVSMAKEGGVG